MEDPLDKQSEKCARLTPTNLWQRAVGQASAEREIPALLNRLADLDESSLTPVLRATLESRERELAVALETPIARSRLFELLAPLEFMVARNEGPVESRGRVLAE